MVPVAVGLQVLTAVACLIPIALTLAMPDTYARRAVVMELLACGLALPVLIMTRRGQVVAAGTVAITGMWIILTLASATGNGIHNPAFNGYIVMIAGAGLLRGQRAAFLTAAASVASGLVLLLLDAHGLLPHRVYTPVAVWGFNTIYFIMAAAVLSLATSQVTSSSELARRESAGRLQTEAQLLESEERFHRLADATHEGIVFTEHGSVVDVNQQLAAMLGLESKNIIGRPVRDFVAPESVDTVLRHVRTLSEEPYEHQLLHQDGSRVDVEARARTMPFGGRQIRVTSLRDITAQKRAGEERLRLLSAIEQAGEMVVITDALGIIQYMNRTAEQSSGHDRGGAVGQRITVLLESGDDSRFYLDARRKIFSGRAWVGRLPCQRKDGTTYLADMSIAPVRSPSGDVVAAVAVGRDVTADLAMEDERRQAQKMETIGRLAGGVAHDFNNLLSPILGYAELLLAEVPADHPHHEPVSIIYAAADRAKHLTLQLLAFGRKQVIEIRPVDLAQVVREFERILRRTIREDVEISLRLSTEPSVIEGDARQIEQILMNLAINAQDAMAHGGRLSIETALVTVSPHEPGSRRDLPPGPYVRLTVGDTGSGIDPSIVPHIFEPFFTTKEKGRGTGLGLSTVHGIVTQLRGHIRVDTTAGVETRFHIYLPRAEGPTEAMAPRVEAVVMPSGRETIVVAEDDDMVRGLVCGTLRRRGYTVIEVAQAERCLEAITASGATPDLLLTDVVMPKLNGRELYASLSQRLPGLKVIYMSGYLDDVIGTHGVLEDDVTFIQKPFSVEALVIKLREMLDR
ncbi:MAG: PAS domain S-box protein [Acidobacteriota bacterium]